MEITHNIPKESIHTIGMQGFVIMAGALALGVIHHLTAPLQKSQQQRLEQAELALFTPEMTKDIRIEPIAPALLGAELPGSANLAKGGQQASGTEPPSRIQPQGIALPVFRALKNNEVEAVIVTVVAPQGYEGPITLRLGVRKNGQITAARVVPPHHETAGWGDKIELNHSPWILQFGGQPQTTKKITVSEADTSFAAEPTFIALKTEGGEIDGISGATVTSRAVVSAINNALHYVQQNHQALFGDAPNSGNLHE